MTQDILPATVLEGVTAQAPFLEEATRGVQPPRGGVAGQHVQVDARESERVEGMVEQQVDRRAPEATAPVAVVADEDVQLSATVRPVDVTQVAEADEPIVLVRAQREVAGRSDHAETRWSHARSVARLVGTNDPTSDA